MDQNALTSISLFTIKQLESGFKLWKIKTMNKFT